MVDILTESVAVPFSAIKSAIQKLEYASVLRCMFIMLVITGCRLQALERMKLCMLQDGVLYYHPGKKQKRYLKVELPDWYLVELAEYRRTHRVHSDLLFGVSSTTFRRYFAAVRPYLGVEWNERVFIPRNDYFCDSYKLQLKGIRKTVMTKTFKDELDKWNDSGVALEMTSKKFSHSTKHMTAYHYLRDFEQLGLRPEKKGRTLFEELVSENQHSILEYL